MYGYGPVSADGQPARNSFLAHGALFDLFALCSNFVLVSDGEKEKESERGSDVSRIPSSKNIHSTAGGLACLVVVAPTRLMKMLRLFGFG